MAEKKQNKKNKIFSAGHLRNAMQGRSFLSLPFFKRYWVYVLAITIMMLMYISNKYNCQNNLHEVISLTRDLSNAKTDCVDASAKYNSMIRESQMTDLVNSMGLDLSMPQQPPYNLADEAATADSTAAAAQPSTPTDTARQ